MRSHGKSTEVAERTLGVLLDEIRTLLWTDAGILRDAAGLSRGLERLDDLRNEATDLAVGDATSRSVEFALDLDFGLLVADAILRSALKRVESRGAHFRTDYPDTDPEWRRNVVLRRESDGSLRSSTEPVGTPSQAVGDALDAG